MKVLVVGAQLANKGAESMLYITTSEVKKRFPDCEVFFATIEDYNEEIYCFEKVYYSERAKIIALGGITSLIELGKAIIWDIGKYIIGKRSHLGHYYDVKRIMPNIDIIIDVSGFAIGTKWSKRIHKSYLNNIRLAQKFNKPIYLMPQSFGPFDYNHKMKSIKKQLKSALQYPKLIFAREKEGFIELHENFKFSNVKLSADLVLQNKGYNLSYVFKTPPGINVPIIDNTHSVGIVPNVQCFNHGDKEVNIRMYISIIKKIIDVKYNIILFRHSREDIEVCKILKNHFATEDKVQLETKEFSSIEYDKYVKQFQFIICSRYHGCVHAYRNYIPCILLGWAVKYKELAENVGQGKYAFDITADNFDSNDVIMALEDMINNREAESAIIKDHVSEIQKHNCFDLIEECLH